MSCWHHHAKQTMGKEEDKHMRSALFDSGKADPDRTDPEYLEGLHTEHSWIRDIYETQKFLPTVPK